MRTCIGAHSQSSTRIRSGGGRRWSTCIKRWNVATLSPRRRGDTARPIQGDRRKPRERRRNPKSRRVGGTGKPSVLHPKAQRRRQAVEGMHQAVERRHALPQTKGRHRAANPKATGGSPVRDAAARRVGGSVARESPQSSTRRRSGGGRRWSACIKRWNVATLSPRRRGDTARPISTQPEESAGRLPG